MESSLKMQGLLGSYWNLLRFFSTSAAPIFPPSDRNTPQAYLKKPVTFWLTQQILDGTLEILTQTQFLTRKIMVAFGDTGVRKYVGKILVRKRPKSAPGVPETDSSRKIIPDSIKIVEFRYVYAHFVVKFRFWPRPGWGTRLVYPSLPTRRILRN